MDSVFHTRNSACLNSAETEGPIQRTSQILVHVSLRLCKPNSTKCSKDMEQEISYIPVEKYKLHSYFVESS